MKPEIVSFRMPIVSPFCEATYALLRAYAADGHIAPVAETYVQGTASLLVRVSDTLEQELAEPSWGRCDADVVLRACKLTANATYLHDFARATLEFRTWLHATGRSGDAGLETLSSLVHAVRSRPFEATRLLASVSASPGPFAPTMDLATAMELFSRLPRSQRRAAMRSARRARSN
jgi:hypothetical protein